VPSRQAAKLGPRLIRYRNCGTSPRRVGAL
jgi:hypothetical protein